MQCRRFAFFAGVSLLACASARRCGSCVRREGPFPSTGALRGDGDILEAIAHPELAAELTLQPVRRYGVDAAILFSDIVVPLAAIGVGVEIVPDGARSSSSRSVRSEDLRTP